MPDLRQQLQNCCQGSVCLVGIGNIDLGDDGFGVRLADILAAFPQTRSTVLVTGTMPERFIGRIAEAGFDHVLFLDAIEFGGAPGEVVLLSAGEILARFPQVSTHKLSLGLLAKWVESDGNSKAWLLGAQPSSLKPGFQLTPPLQRTLEVLSQLLAEVLQGSDLSPLQPDDGNELVHSPEKPAGNLHHMKESMP